MNKILKKCYFIAALLIITLAILSSVFRAMTPWAQQYKTEVESHLSRILGKPVSIGTMETGWYWFEPIIKLQQVSIASQTKNAINLEQLQVGINLLDSLWYWRIQPGLLALDNVNLLLDQTETGWAIQGLGGVNSGVSPLDPRFTQQFISWLAAQEKLVIRSVGVHLHFKDGTIIPVSDLNLVALRNGEHYLIKGRAQLAQLQPTTFQLQAEIDYDSDYPEETQGHIYLGVKNLQARQWQQLLPLKNLELEGGRGDVKVWMDLQDNKISLLQSKVNFKLLALHKPGSDIRDLFQTLKANIAYQPQKEGWSLKADQIKLRSMGKNWPENQISVSFNHSEKLTVFYIRHLLLDPFLQQVTPWFSEFSKLQGYNLQGYLQDTRMDIKEDKLNKFLTRFMELSFQGNDKLPSAKNLSGALYWQPSQGKLNFDGQNSIISLKNYPDLDFTLLNSSLEWVKQDPGYLVNLTRFAAVLPQLTLSGEGAISGVSADGADFANLVLDFNGSGLEKWLAFIPHHRLKPKLEDWLTYDIKGIDQGSGQLIFKGKLADYPFDNTPGEFTIKAHGNGIALKFTEKWPLVKDIDAFITVNKRDFNADIYRGNLNGIPLKQLNLNIHDIGNDKELLLIKGAIEGPVQNMIEFILDSPLKTKLVALQKIMVKGLASLDLQLQIPLYPENNEILTLGSMNFANNSVQINYGNPGITLDEFNGHLLFDEKGITESMFSGKTWGYPLTIKMESVHDKIPFTRVLLNGQLSMDELRKQFDLPGPALLQGQISLDGQFKITDSPRIEDSFHIQSDLKGLKVNLPPPFAKVDNETKPLKIDIDFNPEDLFRLRFNYAQQLSADLYYKWKKKRFQFDNGQIRLGSRYAVKQDLPGLQLVGYLREFDVTAWKGIYKQLQEKSNKNSLFNQLVLVNLYIGKTTLLKQDLKNLFVKAKRLANLDWSIYLKQEKIAGDLNYHPQDNTLSGRLSRLTYIKPQKAGFAGDDYSITPGQVPNLNLRIDSLKANNLELGDLTFTSHSTPTEMTVNYCQLNSPAYQMNIKGDWTQKENKDNTHLDLQIKVNNLGKALEVMKIEPVVTANHGEVQFKGGWNNKPYNFSIKSLQGQAYMYFKNGEVTNLSPETEQKLGLGKLLSILSLQTIPRRLSLDFSDLSSKGYSFDVFKGTFQIKNGVMSTTDSYVDGPVAYASMKGDLNLDKRLYDMELHISPHITASLPVVATIAGGPIAGIAAWVATKLINQSMQKITGYTYKITGPWKEPDIKQLKIYKQKTPT